MKQNRVIFPEEFTELDVMQKKVNQLINDHGIYRGYCFSRFCQDCCVLVSYNTTKPIANKVELYKKNITAMERFANHFIDKLLPIYLDHLPALKLTRFATEPAYRHDVIAQRNNTEHQIELSVAEREVLYWSAQGKKAVEIASITGLTKNTVDTYRRRLIEKFSADNITQAVYLAAAGGYIV